MRKIILLGLLFLNAGLLRAQRFFYVEANHITEKAILAELTKSSQFVVKSPLVSDYTVKTTIGREKGTDIMKMEIILQDSVSCKTIFQTREAYRFAGRDTYSAVYLNFVINRFIDKNMSRMIASAKTDHCDRMRY